MYPNAKFKIMAWDLELPPNPHRQLKLSTSLRRRQNEVESFQEFQCENSPRSYPVLPHNCQLF